MFTFFPDDGMHAGVGFFEGSVEFAPRAEINKGVFLFEPKSIVT